MIANQIIITGCTFKNSNIKNIQNKNQKYCEIFGGAFYSQSVQLLIANSFFEQSYAAKGGAIFWVPRFVATLSISNSRFKNNEAQIENKYSQGGAIYIESGSQNQLDVNINDVFAENNFSNLDGGFLSMSYSRRKVAILIKNSQFINNFAINGGLFSVDSSIGAKGYLIMESVQLYVDLNQINSKIVTMLQNSNEFQPHEISHISFTSTQTIDFKDISCTVIPDKLFYNDILMNQVLYQSIARFKKSIEFTIIGSSFFDTVVFQTLIDVLNSRDIIIQKSSFLNIQSLKQFYINQKEFSKIKYDTNSIDNALLNDNFLQQLTESIYYHPDKSTLLLLDAKKSVSVFDSKFRKLMCSNCILGPIFIAAQITQVLQSEFHENQGKNGGAIHFQYSLKRLHELNQQNQNKRQLFEQSQFEDLQDLSDQEYDYLQKQEESFQFKQQLSNISQQELNTLLSEEINNLPQKLVNDTKQYKQNLLSQERLNKQYEKYYLKNKQKQAQINQQKQENYIKRQNTHNKKSKEQKENDDKIQDLDIEFLNFNQEQQQKKITLDQYKRQLDAELEQQKLEYTENSEFQRVFIVQCQFINNTAYNGGGIYLSDTYVTIKNCSFEYNNADGYGGAIFNSAEHFDEIQSDIINDLNSKKGQVTKKLYNVEIVYTQLAYNVAAVGGAYYSNDKFPNINEETTTIYQNVAKLYGQDTQVDPYQMSVIYKGEKLMNNSQIIHNSGYFSDEFTVFLLGKQNEQFKNFKRIKDDIEIEEHVYLDILHNSNSQYVQVYPTDIQFLHGNFNLTKSVQVLGNFGSIIHLSFKCSKISQPYYDKKTQQFTSNKRDYTFQCPPGTKIQKLESRYDYCQNCMFKSYSLEYSSLTCHKCPISNAMCEKNIIQIPDGYWRKSKNSANIADCRNQRNNCLGDINATDPSLEAKKKINHWQNQGCAEGHTGALCEDCDLRGKYWKSQYQRVNQFSCTDCNSVAYNWFFVIMSQTGQVLLTIIIVFSSIKYIQSKILADYLMKMKLYYFGASFEQLNRSSLYIKILINYFQVISCLSTFRLDIPNQLNFFYKIVGNPLETVLYAQDCLLITYFMNLDDIYYRLFISHAQIIFLIFCIYICLLVYSCIKKTKINTAILICSINYSLYSNLPSMVNLIIGTISCVDVGGEQYVKLFTSIECNEEHTKQSKLILWPLLGLWVIAIPMTQLFCLFIKRNSLNTIRMKYSFGFLYNEYSPQCYWWEIVKTYQKIFIIIVLNMYEQRVIVKGCIILSIVFIVMCITQECKPFLVPQLNFMDKISSIVCCVTIAFGIVLTNYNQSAGTEYGIYSIVGTINLIFLSFNVKKILAAYWFIFLKKIEPYLDRFNFKISRYKTIQEKWKKFRDLVINKIRKDKQNKFKVKAIDLIQSQYNQQCAAEIKTLYHQTYAEQLKKQQELEQKAKQTENSNRNSTKNKKKSKQEKDFHSLLNFNKNSTKKSKSNFNSSKINIKDSSNNIQKQFNQYFKPPASTTPSTG